MKNRAKPDGANLRLRLSSYATLGVACLCLGYAEQPFFEGILFWLLPLLVVFVVAFVAEGRVILPIWAANVLGCLIFAVMGLWMVHSIRQADELWLQSGLGPAVLLPYLGPFLMVLLAVKLFRPKQAGEFWQLHGIGLMEVALGAVLASDPAFVLFLIAYLLGAVWCLALFHLECGHASAPQPGGTATAAASRQSVSLAQAGRWALACLVLAMLVFLMTPRAGQSKWNPLRLAPTVPGGGRELQTGFSESIDLNRTGRIEIDNEVVIEVQAQEKDGSPKLDVHEGQRWRVGVVDNYDHGKWRRDKFGSATGPTPRTGAEELQPENTLLGPMTSSPLPGLAGMRGPMSSQPVRPEQPPLPPVNLGPSQFSLTIRLNTRKVNRLVLADPLVYESGPKATAVVPSGEGAPLFWEPPGFGTLLALARMPSGNYSYRQLSMPLPEAELAPLPVQIDDTYLQFMAGQGVPPELQAWTDRLLQRIAGEQTHGLTPEDLERVRLPVSPADGRRDRLQPDRWEKVARALCAHLAFSGEFTYTLELRRQDPSLDAAVDFLQNTRQGHCERFASALALMLRSQGIPCRVVKGFRGAESHGDGFYDVRNSDAHSWVEALVQRRGPAGQAELHWLSLDPTPASDLHAAASFSWAELWRSGRLFGKEIWKNFLLDYDSDQQGALGQQLAALWAHGIKSRSWFRGGSAALLGVVLSVVPVGFIGFWLVRRRRRQRPASNTGRAPADPGYRRLLAILARRCRLRPEPALTPREFGAVAADYLRSRGLAAEVPGQVVALFYRARFGRQAVDDDERRELDCRLDGLDAALRESGFPA